MNGTSLASSLTRRPGDGSEIFRTASAALRSLLARVENDRRATAWQDGLDLLAVLAGLKPVCVIGRWGNEAWAEALRAAADRADLPRIDSAPWEPEPPDEQLPRWYLAATARRRANRHVLYIFGDGAAARDAATLSAKGRVGAAEEAALLGYPPCCVAAQHSRTLDLEKLVAEIAERVAKGDSERMTHMIEAGAMPLPISRQDWDRYSAAVAIAPAASTSVNMCSGCVADRESPAQALSRRYRALAALADYPSL